MSLIKSWFQTTMNPQTSDRKIFLQPWKPSHQADSLRGAGSQYQYFINKWKSGENREPAGWSQSMGGWLRLPITGLQDNRVSHQSERSHRPAGCSVRTLIWSEALKHLFSDTLAAAQQRTNSLTSAWVEKSQIYILSGWNWGFKRSFYCWNINQKFLSMSECRCVLLAKYLMNEDDFTVNISF